MDSEKNELEANLNSLPTLNLQLTQVDLPSLLLFIHSDHMLPTPNRHNRPTDRPLVVASALPQLSRAESKSGERNEPISLRVAALDPIRYHSSADSGAATTTTEQGGAHCDPLRVAPPATCGKIGIRRQKARPGELPAPRVELLAARPLAEFNIRHSFNVL